MGTKVRVFRPGSWGEPQRSEIAVSEVLKIPQSPDTIIFETGNGKTRIQVGDQFPSRAGGRLIVRVRWNGQDPGVFYFEDGVFYGHNALYFWKESWMEAFQTGAFWARGGAILAQIQVELCMGIMAGGLGTAAHWALTATDVLHLLSEVDVVGLIKGFPKLLKARRILKKAAPDVYDKLFSKFLEQMLENVGEALASAATAHFVGRAIGRMGRHVPGKLAQTAKEIALWAGTYFAIRILAVIGAAGSDMKVLAVDMKNELKAKFGITVSDAEALRMVEQMAKNRPEVMEAFQLIQGIDVGAKPVAAPVDYTRRWPHGRNSP